MRATDKGLSASNFTYAMLRHSQIMLCFPTYYAWHYAVYITNKETVFLVLSEPASDSDKESHNWNFSWDIELHVPSLSAVVFT